MKKYLLLSIAFVLLLQSCSKDNTEPEIKLTGLSLNQEEVSLNPEGTFQLSASFNPENASNKELSWTSSDESIVTVSQSGKVTAVEIGEAIITANNVKYGKSATSKVIVKQVPIAKIVLEFKTLDLKVGSKKTVSIETSPDNAPEMGLKWTSSDPSIASVTDEGEITAIKVGEVEVTITTAEGDVSESLTVTVSPILVETITLNKKELTLKAGASETLTAVIAPPDATDLTLIWSTSNSKVATVDANGAVTAISEGVATITAKSADGKVSASAKLTVTPRFTFLALNKAYKAQDGLTVTLSSFIVEKDSFGTYSYYILYTLKNNTKAVIDENTFKMHQVGNGDPERQYGFFGRLFPGDDISRSYTFKSTTELGILEFGAGFFSTSPEDGTLKWQAPKAK